MSEPTQQVARRTVTVADSLSKAKFHVGKLNREDYQPSGRFPIIDQGQKEVAGWSNNASLVYDGPLPAVIFGDHTRAVKLVDEPFVAGADGVKVLVPDPALFDSQFFYYSLRALDIPARGYNRHFAVLKEQTIVAPPLREQRAIANVLSTIQRAREAVAQELKVTDAIIYSLLDRYLDETLARDRPKLVPLTDLVERDRPICYGILKPGPDVESGIPYVRVVDYPAGQVIVKRLRRVSPLIAYQYRRASLRAGDILVSIRGTFGKVARVPDELDGANITQDTARVSPSAAIEKDFLLWYLRSRRAQEYMRESATGVAVRGVNIGALRQLPVPLPPRDRQKTIAIGVQAADDRRRAVVRHLEAIGQLFDAAHGELLSGKRVVAR